MSRVGDRWSALACGLWLAVAAPAGAAALGAPGHPAAAAATTAAPGELTAAVPARVALPGVRAAAWKIAYTSTSAAGAPIAVTGAVIAPAARARRGGPLVALGAGSQGLADRCAPSRNLRSGALLESVVIAALVARGWSVVLPDGEGLGVAGPATYGVGTTAGRVMLDAVRAARQVDGAALPAGGPVGLLGYSVGGGAVAWAAQLQPAYAPDLPLAGAALGGAVVDVPAYVDRGLRSGATVAGLSALLGFAAAFPELNLARHLTARGALAAHLLRRTCIYEALALVGLLGAPGRERFLVSDPFADSVWSARAQEERPGRTPPEAPVLLFHGAADQAVPLGGAVALREAWRAAGADVRWQPVRAEHVGAMVVGQGQAIDWLARHFAHNQA